MESEQNIEDEKGKSESKVDDDKEELQDDDDEVNESEMGIKHDDIHDVQNTELEESPTESNEGVNLDANPETVLDSTTEVKAPAKRGRKKRGKIYDDDDDPDTIKEKRKKRAIELKLKSLKCSFNETTEVSGKRQKKPPQRFELQPTEKRKSSVDDGKGRGEFLGNIRWINHQLRAASLYTLRLLHRLIYRKQGMFAEKHIIKSVMKFNGFPFDTSHPELKRRREQLERLPNNALQQLSYLLGLRPGSSDEMMDKIINFLLCPLQRDIEPYITEIMDNKIQQSKTVSPKPLENPFQKNESPTFGAVSSYQEENHHLPCFPEFSTPAAKIDLTLPWKKPSFFIEGHGVKLKYIRAVISNIEAASDAFIELMHRLLFLDIDEKANMRRNILEFSGLKCDIGTPNYIYRVRILSVLPMEQLKLICRVLCLPTWHRSRQFLTDGIMDFLAVPRISAMKKRVPPVFSEEISFSFETAKIKKPEMKSVESEEIEIIPDIHISDETSSHLGGDFHMENEYLGVKLKNFSNIHYQVISTPTAKLNEVHMILYLTPCAQNNIRRNILEFSGFPFDENSSEYLNRRTLMEQLTVEDLKTVATVLCVFQYICGDSKKSLIDAILKFLLKPSALLSSSTIMPTISQAPIVRTDQSVVKKKATSTTICSKASNPTVIRPEIVISNVGTSKESKDSSMKALIDDKNNQNGEKKMTKTAKKPDNGNRKLMETTTQRKRRLQKARQKYKEKRANEDQKEKEDRLLKRRRLYKDMSVQKKANCLERDRVRKAQARAIETPLKSISSSGKNEPKTEIEIEKVKACLSNSSIQITPVPLVKVEKEIPCKVDSAEVICMPLKVEKEISPCKVDSPKVISTQANVKIESKDINGSEADEPLSDVKIEAAPPRVQYFGSDDEDDQPLSKMIGHPNDDQLRALVSKIIKESKLEDITMKHVIRKVFETYPNYDLNYRKEFIKSNVRLILSQMDDQSCSVSTTVITI